MTAQVHLLELARLKERVAQVRANLCHAAAGGEIASPMEQELVTKIDQLADVILALIALMERVR